MNTQPSKPIRPMRSSRNSAPNAAAKGASDDRKMAACAADLAFGESEFELAGLTPARATHVQAPLVQEAPVNIECSLRQVVRMGDQPGASAVVFGDILALHVRDDILDATGKAVDPRKMRAVGRLGGGWYCTVTEPYELSIPKPAKKQG